MPASVVAGVIAFIVIGAVAMPLTQSDRQFGACVVADLIVSLAIASSHWWTSGW